MSYLQIYLVVYMMHCDLMIHSRSRMSKHNKLCALLNGDGEPKICSNNCGEQETWMNGCILFGSKHTLIHLSKYMYKFATNVRTVHAHQTSSVI